MNSVQPLHRFPLLRTTDFDEMRTALTQIYACPRMELTGRERTLSAVINHYRLPSIEASFAAYAANLRMEFPETNFVSQVIPVCGAGEAHIRRKSFAIDAGRSLVISANESFSQATGMDYARLILRANVGLLMSKLAVITGEHAVRPLKFDPIQDWSRPLTRTFRDHFLFLVSKVGASTVPLPRMLLLEFEQALAVMFLFANRSNYSALLERELSEAAPAQLRRAEEFIEANWNTPVTLEAVAAAAGSNIRSLSRIFRRRRGCSPLEFLRQVRMRRAREYLQRPDETATLQEVATTCGFVDVDAFAKAYRQVFGEEPGDTLARGRRPRLH